LRGLLLREGGAGKGERREGRRRREGMGGKREEGRGGKGGEGRERRPFW